MRVRSKAAPATAGTTRSHARAFARRGGAGRHIATVEDFSLINLDHVWNGRPFKGTTDLYGLRVLKDAHAAPGAYVYVLESRE
jgi:hypothetical protein